METETGLQLSNSNKTIEIGTKNGYKGDFIRIITRAPVSNNAQNVG